MGPWALFCYYTETKCSISFIEVAPHTEKLLSKCILILQSRNEGITEGHGKSCIAPLFQSGVIKMKTNKCHLLQFEWCFNGHGAAEGMETLHTHFKTMMST